MIAVLFQYELPSGFVHWLFPTALTIDATHDGPRVLSDAQAVAESSESGMTQETPLSLQFEEMSDKTAEGELDVRGPFLARALLTDRDADVG